MLRIRQEQQDALRVQQVKRFEDWMVHHVSRFFPKHYDALGEDKTRELVREGITRAGRHGIVAERDVCKFIDLMVGFGVEFDVDPKLPWARRILEDPSQNDPSVKVDALYDAGMEHLRLSPQRPSR